MFTIAITYYYYAPPSRASTLTMCRLLPAGMTEAQSTAAARSSWAAHLLLLKVCFMQ